MDCCISIGEVVKRWKLKEDVRSIEVQGAQVWTLAMVFVNLIMLMPCVMGRLNVVESSIP